MNTKNRITDDVVQTLLHDISGPIATSRGIQRELEDSIRALTTEISALDSQMSPARLKKLQSVLEGDIEPCMEHLNASLSTLHSRVKEFAITYTGK